MIDDPDLQSRALGALRLESGETIPDLTMSFVTRGRLNAARDNAVLLLHGLVADHRQLGSWVGADSIFDSDRYLMILPDTLAVVTGGTRSSRARTAGPRRS